MKLNNLPKNHKRKHKIIGRGYGSGKGGHTVGKGQKGQTTRSGFKKIKNWIRESKLDSYPKLRGIGKRNDKRGYFKRKIDSIILNLSDLDSFKSESVIDPVFLIEHGFIGHFSKKRKTIKILGRGDIKGKYTIKDIAVSDMARDKIVKAGGQVL